MLNIIVVGKLNAGKSSFINALSYKILPENLQMYWNPITTMAMLHETFQPIKFIATNSLSNINYKNISEENSQIRRVGIMPDLKIIEKNIYMPTTCINNIIDYCGLDDEGDKRPTLEYLLEIMETTNIVIFITKADSPLTEKRECELLEKINKRAEEIFNAGKFIEVIVVVSKYDDEEDEEYKELFNSAERKTKTKIFKWSSYGIFANIKLDEPRDIKRARNIKNKGDIGGLINYLNFININIEDKKKLCKENYIGGVLSGKIKVGFNGKFNECLLYARENKIFGDLCLNIYFKNNIDINKFYINEEILNIIKNNYIDEKYKNKWLEIFSHYNINNLENYKAVFALIYDEIKEGSEIINKNPILEFIIELKYIQGVDYIIAYNEYKYHGRDYKLFKGLSYFNIDKEEVLKSAYLNLEKKEFWKFKI